MTTRSAAPHVGFNIIADIADDDTTDDDADDNADINIDNNNAMQTTEEDADATWHGQQTMMQMTTPPPRQWATMQMRTTQPQTLTPQ
jgi:hypothetical protein